MDVIEKKISVSKAAKQYGVPEQTLRDRVKGKVAPETIKSGPSPLFSIEEEMRLVDHIKSMSQVGYGYTRAEVINLGSSYAVQLGKRDSEHPLTEQWFYNMLSRWPDLKVCKPRTLTEVRAKATSKESITKYFSELNRIMSKYNLLENLSAYI